MKKLFKIFSILALSLMFLVSCSTLKSTMKSTVKSVTSVFKSPTKYNNVTVTFVTTQGEITFFLYPEAAPLTVANFINLAKRGFYDNTKFTRSVDNFIVQGGDPTGTGMGGPGYTIPDEFVEWLDFYQPGMLAMANAGPNTGGSQSVSYTHLIFYFLLFCIFFKISISFQDFFRFSNRWFLFLLI